MEKVRPYDELQKAFARLREELNEAKDTIEAIKNGEVDALVVHGKNGHELYTLKSADHTYRVFIEKMTEGAVTLNHTGVIVYSNSSFATMVGRQQERVVGSLFEDFVPPTEHDTFFSLVHQGWIQDVKGELNLVQNDLLIPVQLSITTLHMDDGISLSIIITDLTAQKETLLQLKQKNEQLEAMNIALELSNHDLQQFASVASHDLQEPLRKIQVFSHLLKEKFAIELPETAQQYLEKIMSSSNRMKVLIIDILNYSRLSANDNQYEWTDLNMMVDELLEDLELTIREKKAKITVHILPHLDINRGQMRQVFQNLISNAMKFCKVNEDPVIELFCRDHLDEFLIAEKKPGGYYHLHIKDNGIGFDEKYAKSIFNLFEKLHSKDDYEGTGIGLAIAKKIIEKHNGYINVISKVGVGTEFIISLPIHQTFLTEREFEKRETD